MIHLWTSFLNWLNTRREAKARALQHAYPEAEGLKKAVDDTLEPDSFGAQWFFLADQGVSL